MLEINTSESAGVARVFKPDTSPHRGGEVADIIRRQTATIPERSEGPTYSHGPIRFSSVSSGS